MPENTQSYQVCEFTQKVNMLPNCFRAFFGLKKELELLLQGDLNPATAGFRFIYSKNIKNIGLISVLE